MAPKLASGWRHAMRAAFALVLAGLASLAANPANATTATIRVANFQNTIVLPLYYGMEKGYFKDAGIDIHIVKVATGAASVSAVASGQADIGWAAVAVPIFARANGVKVKIFMTANQEGPPDHYDLEIIASGKSGITNFAQMKGKTVMINAFGTATELAIRERLQKAGVSWNDVKKVVVPFPQMPAAIELGNADVAVTINPMAGEILADKALHAKVLAEGVLLASQEKPITVSCYFATDAWLAKHRNTALAFGRAYLRAAKEVSTSAALRTKLMEKFLGMKPKIAAMMPDSVWFKDLAVKKAAIAPNYQALVKTGMLTKKLNIDDAFVTLPY